MGKIYYVMGKSSSGKDSEGKRKIGHYVWLILSLVWQALLLLF